MKKLIVFVLVALSIFVSQKVFSQLGGGFSFSLPIPMPPRITNVQDNSLSTPPGQPVTVTAKIIVHTPLKIDTSTTPITLEWGQQLQLYQTPTLYWTTNYETGNPPTWNSVDMEIINTENRSDIDHTIVYTVRGQIPGQAAGTKVTYAIEAYDTNTNANAGQGRNMVVERRGKKDVGPGWGTSWNNDLSIQVGETAGTGVNPNENLRYKDQYQQQNIPLPNDLDYLEIRAASGKESGKDKLFLKSRVEGQFNKGSNDLSAANAYLAVVLTMRRPLAITYTNEGPKTNMEGMYALINLPNATQPPINSIIPQNPCINCIECAITGSSDYGFVSTLQSGISGYPESGTGTSEYQLKVEFAKLQHHSQRDPGPLLGPDGKGYSLYDPTGYICIFGSAIVNAMDLNNISFSICDLTNGFTYYNRNKTYTVQTPQTYQVSGEIYSIIHTGDPLDANTVKSNLKLYNSLGQQVSINPTVGNPQQVNYGNIPQSSYPKKYKYTYNFSVVAGNYTLKITPSNYIPDEISLELSGNLSGKNLTFYSPAAGGDIAGTDRKIDEQDLQVLINHFGQSGNISQGDLNGNGKVDLVDFGIMVKNWYKTY